MNDSDRVTVAICLISDFGSTLSYPNIDFVKTGASSFRDEWSKGESRMRQEPKIEQSCQNKGRPQANSPKEIVNLSKRSLDAANQSSFFGKSLDSPH